MDGQRSRRAASVLGLLLVLVGTAPIATPASAAASTACTPQTYPFAVINVVWGTPSSPLSVYPGNQNVPLSVTLLFSGPCSSPQATFTLSLSSGSAPLPFSQPSGNSPSTVTLNISPNTLVTETFYLNVFPNAQTGVTYPVLMTVQYASNDPSNIITQTLNVPVLLQAPVSISYTPNITHLLAGAVNNVTISISNSGGGISGPIFTTVSAPTSVTLLNQLATTPGLSPGASNYEVLQLFVPSSLTGGAFSLSLTGKYLDAYLNSQTMTQTVGFVVSTPTVQPESSFVVQSAVWGSASSPSPIPGTLDTPLVVNLQYLGSTPVTSLGGTVQLPQGITDVNGRGTATAFSSSNVNQFGAVQVTFYLDIATTMKPGSYDLTLGLTWMTSQSLGLSQTVALTPPPIAQLQSYFQVEGASWGTAATSTVPIPGTQNTPLVVTLQYIGTTGVTNIKGTITMPGGITDLNGHQTESAYAASASPNQVVALNFYVDVGSGVRPGSYNFTLDLSWTTSVSTTLSQSNTVSPAPVASPTTTTSYPLTVVEQNSTIVAGSQTAATFQLTNLGSSPIYSPTFALTVASPLVLGSIGSPVPTSELDSGKSTTFVAHLTSSPSATAGIYSGTLTVAFTDSNGASHSQAFPVGFTLQGTIILILQNTAVTQTTTTLTVTGSILNEGTVAAYYASITGLMGTNAATPVYVGEIDPNTPVPFSITIPYLAPTNSTTTAPASRNGTANTATITSRTFVIGNKTTVVGGPGNPRNGSFPGGFPRAFNSTRSAGGAAGTANIAIALTFKDSFSKNQAQSFTVPTTIRSASELAARSFASTGNSSANGPMLTDVAYGVIGAIAATVIVGAVMLKRHRTKKMASLPPDQRGEQAVI